MEVEQRELFENTMNSKGHSLNIKWVCNNSEAIKMQYFKPWYFSHI